MPYTDYITKVLGLEDAIILKVEENEKQHDIYLMMQRRAHVCPVCGLETIRVHDYRWQKVKDLAAFGKTTVLHIRKRRYVCALQEVL